MGRTDKRTERLTRWVGEEKYRMIGGARIYEEVGDGAMENAHDEKCEGVMITS